MGWFTRAVFPLGKPLDKEVLQERLTVYGPVFGALRTYRAPDARRSRHILVKDNIAVDGFPTTAGSLALSHLILPESPAATRLKAAGFDLFGKTNMTEFAGFVTTGRPSEGYSHLGGFGKNPHGNFLCGGSSLGSAIAVAAGLCDAALGTETCGSVMEPALYCGVWGFKPSVGLISRRGVIPISPAFDTVGVLSRDVGMLSDLLTALQGEDEHDAATALSSSVHLDEGKDIQARTLRIGVVRVTGTETLDAEVQEILKVAFRKLLISRQKIPRKSTNLLPPLTLRAASIGSLKSMQRKMSLLILLLFVPCIAKRRRCDPLAWTACFWLRS